MATACTGINPTRAMGSPHRATPTPNQRASRWLPTSSEAPSDPTTAPAPTAVLRAPTPDSPMSSRSIATTTENTARAPRIRICTWASSTSTAR